MKDKYKRNKRIGIAGTILWVIASLTAFFLEEGIAENFAFYVFIFGVLLCFICVFLEFSREISKLWESINNPNPKALTEKENKGLKIFGVGAILGVIGFSMLYLMDDDTWGAFVICLGALLLFISMASDWNS